MLEFNKAISVIIGDCCEEYVGFCDVENTFDVKSKETKNSIKDIIETIIDNGLTDTKLFNFNKSKK